MRLIDAEKITDTIGRGLLVGSNLSQEKSWCEGYRYALGFALGVIADAPTADTETRTGGHWILKPAEEIGCTNCRCSVCGEEYFMPNVYKDPYEYCPSCGASMTAEEETETRDHDGCAGCIHEEKKPWENPCRKCKHSHRDLWRPRP